MKMCLFGAGAITGFIAGRLAQAHQGRQIEALDARGQQWRALTPQRALGCVHRVTRDWERGRPLEVDVLLDAINAMRELAGQATPTIDQVYALLKLRVALGALTERFTVQAPALPPIKARGFTGAGVMSELRRFYCDTAQASNPIAMAALTKLVPATQIVFGTDYPYRGALEHVQGLSELFGAADLRLIERDNALRLLPRQRRV